MPQLPARSTWHIVIGVMQPWRRCGPQRRPAGSAATANGMLAASTVAQAQAELGHRRKLLCKNPSVPRSPLRARPVRADGPARLTAGQQGSLQAKAAGPRAEFRRPAFRRKLAAGAAWFYPTTMGWATLPGCPCSPWATLWTTHRATAEIVARRGLRRGAHRLSTCTESSAAGFAWNAKQGAANGSGRERQRAL